MVVFIATYYDKNMTFHVRIDHSSNEKILSLT